MAMRHAQDGRACIAKQYDLIAKLRQRGLSTRKAEDVLTWMVKTQWVLEEDYEKLRQQIKSAVAAASLPVSPASSAEISPANPDS